WAWLMPIHLRAVDASVLQRAGRNTPGLIDRGLRLVGEKKSGAAELLWRAAQEEKTPGREKLRSALENLSKENPQLQILGAADSRLENFLNLPTTPTSLRNQKSPLSAEEEKNGTNSAFEVQSFTRFVVQSENREKAITLLRGSTHPAVQELLRCVELTNTVLFPSSLSSSGQAFDTALSIGGLLLDGQHLTPPLTDALFVRAAAALRGENSQPLEQMLLDFMFLGQRFNWGQLVAFVEQIENPETLRLHANLLRKADAPVPTIFSAVQLSGNPAGVAKYLMKFSQTGQKDLSWSLRFGAGAVNELLKRDQRLHFSRFNRAVAVDLCWQESWFALTVKWLLFLLAGFMLAVGLHIARPATSPLEPRIQATGLYVAREILFAFGFLLVVLLLGEPFLAQEKQNVEFPIRLQLPTVSKAVPAGNVAVTTTIMNQLSLLTLLLFFVLQALIYTACLIKLAEIRRQEFPSRVKLKLLDNEEHLFDAGLYLGFAGTIISLIMVSMGVIKPSLMAAYSSTSFGIIFVSIFKIFHLRPLRRKLLLEAEAASVLSDSPDVL
ncbi:MAG: hypothetical protein M3Y82_12300, partial [Verrucomicrobiota bacterium]|nr:hypothetical protein [Verrucomicrobiota bacterium]